MRIIRGIREVVNSGSLGNSVGNSGWSKWHFCQQLQRGQDFFVLQKLNAFWKHMLRFSFSLLSWMWKSLDKIPQPFLCTSQTMPITISSCLKNLEVVQPGHGTLILACSDTLNVFIDWNSCAVQKHSISFPSSPGSIRNLCQQVLHIRVLP